jgi:hypothetical protein
LGVTTSIISNILGSIDYPNEEFIDGLGTDNSISGAGAQTSDPLFSQAITIGNYDIAVDSDCIRLISREGTYLAWAMLINQNPNVYQPGLTKIYLRQPDGSYVVGYVTVNPLDEGCIIVNWDSDTYPSNTPIDTGNRTSTGTFDAIIDPQRTKPTNVVVGTRYLILEDIGGGVRDTFITENSVQRIKTNILHRNVNDHKIFVDGIEVGSGSSRVPDNVDTGNYYITLDSAIPAGSEIKYELYMNEDGPDAWKNADNSDFIAEMNDIIEWDGSAWSVIFDSAQESTRMLWQTNKYTGDQYMWNGVQWAKAFEGEYKAGEWRLEL